jgi:hypothetical protein
LNSSIEKVSKKVLEMTKKFQRENQKCFGVTGNVLKKNILPEMFLIASTIILGGAGNVLDRWEFSWIKRS